MLAVLGCVAAILGVPSRSWMDAYAEQSEWMWVIWLDAPTPHASTCSLLRGILRIHQP